MPAAGRIVVDSGDAPSLSQTFVETFQAVSERWPTLLAEHWLLLTNLAAALVLLGAFAVAYLRSIGLGWLAEPIATVYLLLCPQRPEHSYFPWGHQMALEQRLVAMFGAQLLGGLAFGLVRRGIRPLDWRLMIFLALPLAWDGVSQTIGLRDSDWLWRTVTGGLFTIALIWFAYPRLDREFGAFAGSTTRQLTDTRRSALPE